MSAYTNLPDTKQIDQSMNIMIETKAILIYVIQNTLKIFKESDYFQIIYHTNHVMRDRVSLFSICECQSFWQMGNAVRFKSSNRLCVCEVGVITMKLFSRLDTLRDLLHYSH